MHVHQVLHGVGCRCTVTLWRGNAPWPQISVEESMRFDTPSRPRIEQSANCHSTAQYSYDETRSTSQATERGDSSAARTMRGCSRTVGPRTNSLATILQKAVGRGPRRCGKGSESRFDVMTLEDLAEAEGKLLDRALCASAS
jgi:hypothetical protein